MLGLENTFMPRADFIARIQAHYTQQVLAQLYKVLGSYEFMGSPVSLVSNLGTGVYDFFYEPANGLVKVPFLVHLHLCNFKYWLIIILPFLLHRALWHLGKV